LIFYRNKDKQPKDRFRVIEATNINGTVLPLVMERNILRPGEKSLTSMISYKIVVTNLTQTLRTPSKPEIQDFVHVVDARFTSIDFPVVYLANTWRSMEDLSNDPLIQKQIKASVYQSLMSLPKPAPGKRILLVVLFVAVLVVTAALLVSQKRKEVN
jgi:hypothetical protein